MKGFQGSYTGAEQIAYLRQKRNSMRKKSSRLGCRTIQYIYESAGCVGIIAGSRSIRPGVLVRGKQRGLEVSQDKGGLLNLYI